MTNCNFSLTHLHLNNYGQARRSSFSSKVIIEIYKGELMQMCTTTQIRSTYTPNNDDLQANDWELIFMDGDEKLHKNYLSNTILDLFMKLENQNIKYPNEKTPEKSHIRDKYDLRVTRILWFLGGFIAGAFLLILLFIEYGNL